MGKKRIIQVVFRGRPNSGYVQSLASSGMLTQRGDGVTFIVEVWREGRFNSLKRELDFWVKEKIATWEELEFVPDK